MMKSTYRALICVTTCQRLRYLRRYLPHFARFCVEDPRFSLLVSLDGTESETLAFCEAWEVPLVYSDESEGVGLSKNRVLERFPDFDYYFFLEDDVELLDGSVFPSHIELSQSSEIHHFSLFARSGLRRQVGESVVRDRCIIHGMLGSADFNFFTRHGLATVGGWHPRFMEFRCGGHTEHSYRFFRAGLAPAPFNVIEDQTAACIWHAPPSVTPHNLVPVDKEADMLVAERELIDSALLHVPVQTVSPHYSNRFPLGPPRRLAAALSSGERYPLVVDGERRQARSGYHLGRYQTAVTVRQRACSLAASAWNWPSNPELRHAVKTALTPRRSPAAAGGRY
jgi:hypothetical protein